MPIEGGPSRRRMSSVMKYRSYVVLATIWCLAALRCWPIIAASPVSPVQVVIFDAADRVVDVPTLYVDGHRLSDPSERYSIVTLELTPSGFNRRSWQARRSAKPVLLSVLARNASGWYSPFAWREFRVFSRKAAEEGAEWPVPQTVSGRAVRGLRLAQSGLNSGSSELWAYLVPPADMGYTATEFYLCRRPFWQSTYASWFHWLSQPGEKDVEIVSSKPPSTYVSLADRLPPVIPRTPGAFGYVTRVPISAGRAHFVFMPQNPLARGDVVAVFPRSGGIGGARLLGCDAAMMRKPGSIEDAFIAITLDDAGGWQSEPALRVSVGGVDPFTLGYEKFEYTCDFSDGSMTTGSQYVRREMIVAWPKGIPVRHAVFHVEGSVIDVAGKRVALQGSTYRINKVEWVTAESSPKWVCERQACAPLPGTGAPNAGNIFCTDLDSTSCIGGVPKRARCLFRR